MTRRKGKVDPHAKPQAAAPSAASYGEPLRPWLLCGMTALLVTRPLFPSESAASYGDGLTMVMLWLALAIFWLLGAIGRPTFSLRFGWIDAAVLALVGWHAVAAVWAAEHGTPRPAVNMLWEWVGMGLCYALARQLIVTPRETWAVAAVMVALAMALSGYGLYQRFYEMPRLQAEYEADPDRAMRDAGLGLPSGSPERKLFEDRLHNREPTATFALTNSLAGFLAPWLVMLAGIGVSAGLSRRRLLGMAACTVPIVACLVLTKSRSGYIATAVGLTLVGLLCRKRSGRVDWKVPAAAAATAAVFLAVVVASGRFQEVSTLASKSFGYRLQYWESSLTMIADHPLVGCGPGNFQYAYTRYKLPAASEEVADPHNFLLEVWATAGTPAMLAFLGVLGCFGFAMMRPQKDFSSNPQSPIPNPSSDAWVYVLAGGACGFLLSVPVGLLSAAPPGMMPVLLGLPLAAVAMMLMLGWIRDGRLPRWLPAVGVAVLLVDLLTTGGIGFPGVAGTLWLLLALGLQGKPPRVLRPWAAWTALLATIALAVVCYGTAYRPVLACQTQLRAAEREPSRAVEHLEAAAAADPLAADPWRQLAAVEFEQWWQQPSGDAFHRFELTNEQALTRTPNAASAWRDSGDWYMRAFSKTDERGEKLAGNAADKAVAAYRNAVQLYPNSAVYRGKLAEAFHTAGDLSSFRREAQQALRLDNLTPHSDKKLPPELRDRLMHALGGKS